MDYDIRQLINNLNKIHTTELGEIRIRRNTGLGDFDIIDWCKNKITEEQNKITKKVKNWYVESDLYIITINASSFTIITVHKKY